MALKNITPLGFETASNDDLIQTCMDLMYDEGGSLFYLPLVGTNHEHTRALQPIFLQPAANAARLGAANNWCSRVVQPAAITLYLVLPFVLYSMLHLLGLPGIIPLAG